VLVLDAGDSLTGDRNPGLSTQGQTSIEYLNMMGYHALALGEQDLGLGVAVLRQRMAEAQFPILSANVVLEGSARLLAEPYVIYPVGDLQVGIIGLTGLASVKGVEVLEPVEAAARLVPEVAAQADLVVLLSHAGAALDRKIADSVPGIAFILGGGKEATRSPEVRSNGTVIAHADLPLPGHAGRYLGILRLTLGDQGQVSQYAWRAFGVIETIPSDPEMQAWVAANRNR
jgi:2',3'-cyclic-nucleotide 2'-phosphodiesterase (5'-nucleotidase family)